MARSSLQLEPSQLLRDARAGNERALAGLLEYYRPYLAILARLDGGRRFQARYDRSDVVQEAELLAYRDFPAFHGTHETELVAWLRQILAHVVTGLARFHLRECRDIRLERQLRNAFDQSSIRLGQALVSPNSSPSGVVRRRERAVILARALAQLPDHYREALILHELEGMTTEEVARRMGRSVDSVQKLLARSLMKMRRLLDQER